ncbi:hypothetical protein EC988_010217, partial [Linderina pennispora]
AVVAPGGCGAGQQRLLPEQRAVTAVWQSVFPAADGATAHSNAGAASDAERDRHALADSDVYIVRQP